ncbi:MAG: hypothetical protein E7532_03350 [Ruminococcaceae bacterium]|nr:hypothetical protein [Oscillospiraceae bacterium]
MDLLKNYYSIHSTTHNDIKNLIKSGNYERIVLDLMNASKTIFPSHYIHQDSQAHGECDFVDAVTGEKFDAKIPINKRQGKIIGSRKGDVSALTAELHREALEFQHCFLGDQKKPIRELNLFKKMRDNIGKTKLDENVIFFIPYPIVFDFENFPLIGACDLLKKIYLELAISIDISEKHLYAIYISYDKKMVLRDLETDKREYLQLPEMQHYVDYNIKHIELD